MRRLVGPLVLSVLAACCSSNPTPASNPGQTTLVRPAPNPCTINRNGQDGPEGAPIVCIDYQRFSNGTQPSPNPVHAWHSDAVQFFFYNVPGNTNVQLSLEFAPETASRIQGPFCQGGHCTIVVLPNATQDISRKYNIVDTVSGKRLDPDILIEPAS